MAEPQLSHASQNSADAAGGNLKRAYVVGGTVFTFLLGLEILSIAPDTRNPFGSVVFATLLFAPVAAFPGALTWIWTQKKESAWVCLLQSVLVALTCAVLAIGAFFFYFASHMAP